MKKLIIEYSTDNAAFEDNDLEESRLLLSVVASIKNGYSEGRLMDSNGNTVGHFHIIGA